MSDTLKLSEPAQPEYAASRDFALRIPMKRGVHKGIVIDFRGTTVGSTAANQDGPDNMVDRLRIEYPRKGGGSYVLEGALRDFRILAEMLNGRAPLRNNSAAAAAQYNVIHLPFYVPGKDQYHLWGIDSDEIGDFILISGTYGALLNYGADTSALTAGQLRFMPIVAQHEPQGRPRAALLPVGTQIPVVAASRVEDVLANGHLDALFGVLFRTHDNSATAATRVDGLISRIELDHSVDGTLLRATFVAIKERGAAFFRVPNAEHTAASPAGHAGTALAVLNGQCAIGGYPSLRGEKVDVVLDAQTTVPVGVTNVVPAASDAVFCTTIGVQFNRAALQRIAG